MKYLKIMNMMAVVALVAVFYSDSLACEEGQVLGKITKECVADNGTCGNGCTWKLDANGNMHVTATNGTIGNTGSNENVTSMTFDVGNNKLGYLNGGFFVGKPNLVNLDLPNEIFSQGAWMEINATIIKKYTGLTSFVMPENLYRMMSSNEIINSTSGLTVYCTGAQINSGGCGSNATRYERNEDGKLVVYDKNGNIKGIYDDYVGINNDKIIDPYEKENSDGSVAKYNGRGQLMATYVPNPDGSTSIYDANGKLTGLKNAKSITPAQAAALIKKCNCNTIKLTFK